MNMSNTNMQREEDIVLKPSEKVECFELQKIYSSLAMNAVVKGFLGGVCGATLMLWCPIARRYVGVLGSGFGLGYAAKEADVFLKNPMVEDLPKGVPYCSLKNSVNWIKTKCCFKKNKD
jgi:hypothetical protein